MWLGHTRDSNEVIIGTAEGAIRAYAVKRSPADERWAASNIKEMQGVPQQVDPRKAGIKVPVVVNLGDEVHEMMPREAQEPQDPLPRRR